VGYAPATPACAAVCGTTVTVTVAGHFDLRGEMIEYRLAE
jgi:hypothetical protein